VIDIVISLRDLFEFILYLAGVTAGILLIIFLVKSIRTVSVIKSVVCKNEENIHKTLNTLPVILKNISSITEDVKEAISETAPAVPEIVEDLSVMTETVKDGVVHVEDAVKIISDGVASTTNTVRNSAEDILSFFNFARDIIKLIIRVFKKS